MDIYYYLKFNYFIIGIRIFFKDIISNNPEILNYELDSPNINPENKEVFKELITNYINKYSFDIVYKYITKYINYEEIFNNKDNFT